MPSSRARARRSPGHAFLTMHYQQTAALTVPRLKKRGDIRRRNNGDSTSFPSSLRALAVRGDAHAEVYGVQGPLLGHRDVDVFWLRRGLEAELSRVSVGVERRGL